MSSKKRKYSKCRREYLKKSLYPAMKNKKDGRKYGYINRRGSFIIEPVYSQAYTFNDSGFAIVESGDKWGVINTIGQYEIKPFFDNINEYKEKRAVFTIKGYMGVLNENGEIISDKLYSFIGDYSDGRAIVGLNVSDDNYRYGYIDLEGKEIIPPIYTQVSDFDDGVALVKINNKQYALIDSYGKIIENYNYDYVSQYGDGLMVYGSSFEGPLGYINKDGKVVIETKFTSAQGFKNSVAVVSESDKYNGPFGLINRSGNYVYEAIYSDIKVLGEDMIALGMPIGDSKDLERRSIYAIGDTAGNKLTDFIYLVVGEYKDGLAYACNNTDTFFIDKKGNISNALPRVKGSGELTIKNEVVYADIDYSPYYLDKFGKIIYKPNDVIILNEKYNVFKDKYKPNINYLIYIPVIQGINDKKIKNEINNKLKEMSYFKPYGEEGQQSDTVIKEDDVLDYNYYGTFEIKYFNNDLLVLNISGYYYPLGAAHGLPIMKTPTINLATGKFYSIGDLFIEEANWKEELNKIIKNQIETDSQYDYVFKDSFKGINDNQNFYIDNNNLYIYFQPYEIGPYSAGFITFKIALGKILNIINKDGEFYKSINR